MQHIVDFLGGGFSIRRLKNESRMRRESASSRSFFSFVEGQHTEVKVTDLCVLDESM